MINFGVGKLWAIPSAGGTPVQFGVLQDVAVNISFDKKELYGSKQFPVKVVRGKGKIEGKAGFAEIDANAFNLILAGTKGVGQNEVTVKTGTIPAETPFTVVSAAGAVNLGVYDVSGDTAVAMELVATTPAAGQYTYAAETGTYTFNTGDASTKIQYSYMTADAVDGSKITLTNELMGSSPTFKTVLNGQLAGKQLTLTLNACMTSKLDLAFKQEDFLLPAFDFSAFADAADEIGTLTIG